MREFDRSMTIAKPSFYILVAISRASGVLQLNMDTFQIRDHTFAFIAPNSRVDIQQLAMSEGIWIFFEGEFLDFFFQDKFFTYKFDFFHGTTSQRPISCSEKEFLQLKEDSNHFLRSSLYLLMIRLNRIYGNQHKSEGIVIQNERVLRFKQMLETGIKKWRTVEDYASQLQISKTYLNKLCKYHFGKNTSELIVERMLLEIKQVLTFTTKDISVIAYEYGFSEPSNFIRFFKKHMLTTPAIYRREFSN